MPVHSPRGAFDALYREFLERGIRYCFPGVDLQRSASDATPVAQLSVTPRGLLLFGRPPNEPDPPAV
jgi:hypothetical protein